MSRPNLRLRTVIVAVLVVALLAAAAADVVLTLRVRERDRVSAAEQAAMSQAATRLPTLLSYSSKTLDHDLDAAVASTTGSFRDDYRTVLEQQVRPNAQGARLTTVASVDGLAVVSGDADRVVVLAFLTQTTTEGSRDPQSSATRVEATLDRVGDAWLVSDLKPV